MLRKKDVRISCGVRKRWVRFEKRLPKPTSEMKDYEKLKKMLNDRETATVEEPLHAANDWPLVPMMSFSFKQCGTWNNLRKSNPPYSEGKTLTIKIDGVSVELESNSGVEMNVMDEHQFKSLMHRVSQKLALTPSRTNWILFRRSYPWKASLQPPYETRRAVLWQESW